MRSKLQNNSTNKVIYQKILECSKCHCNDLRLVRWQSSGWHYGCQTMCNGCGSRVGSRQHMNRTRSPEWRDEVLALPEVVFSKAATKKNRKLRRHSRERSITSSRFYQSREWRKLRFATLHKYGYKCMACGVGREKVLHVDHIKPRSKYPELELDGENLQVLCVDCNLGKSNKFEDDLRPHVQT